MEGISIKHQISCTMDFRGSVVSSIGQNKNKLLGTTIIPPYGYGILLLFKSMRTL